MPDENREFRGIWFPANIWLDERLTALEKMILMEIDSLDGKNGCFASNEYLAKFCQCGQTKISNAISKLKSLGYITVASFDGRTRVLHSCLTNSVTLPYKKCKADSQKVKERILEESTSKEKENICEEPKKTGFRPPTREQVRAYVKEKGFHFDADHFFDYYEASNWHLQGGKKVTRWKQCCVTWEKNATNNSSSKRKLKQGKIDFSIHEDKTGTFVEKGRKRYVYTDNEHLEEVKEVQYEGEDDDFSF